MEPRLTAHPGPRPLASRGHAKTRNPSSPPDTNTWAGDPDPVSRSRSWPAWAAKHQAQSPDSQAVDSHLLVLRNQEGHRVNKGGKSGWGGGGHLQSPGGISSFWGPPRPQVRTRPACSPKAVICLLLTLTHGSGQSAGPDLSARLE